MRQLATPMLVAGATVLATAQAQVCPEWTEEGLNGLDISPECVLACGPGSITGPIPSTLSTVKFGADCGDSAVVSLPGNGITGPIPDNLDSFPANFIDLSGNSGISGEIPASLRANPNLRSLTLSNTGISGTTDSLATGWADTVTSIRVENAQLTGSVVSQDLKTFLATHPGLTEFGFSVTSGTGDCINPVEINNQRTAAELGTISFIGDGFCQDIPTPPPSVFAPVTPAPTDPTASPSQAPSLSPTPRPSSGPTRNPTKQPTEAPPTPRPTAPTPRTLPPSDAGRLSLSAVCIAVATAGLALALQN